MLVEVEEQSYLNKNPIIHEENKNIPNLSPYEKIPFGLKAKETKRQYPKRFQMFLDFIEIKSPSIRDNCNAFDDFVSNANNTGIIEDALIRFFAVQN